MADHAGAVALSLGPQYNSSADAYQKYLSSIVQGAPDKEAEASLSVAERKTALKEAQMMAASPKGFQPSAGAKGSAGFSGVAGAPQYTEDHSIPLPLGPLPEPATPALMQAGMGIPTKPTGGGGGPLPSMQERPLNPNAVAEGRAMYAKGMGIAPEPAAPAEAGQTAPAAQPTMAGKLTGALDFMGKQPKNLAGMLGGLAANALDAWGAGRLAFAGRDSPTRLQREYQMRIASQQQANQAYAYMEAEVQKMPMELQKEMLMAIKQGDIDTAVQIAVAHGNYDVAANLERLKNSILYANSQTSNTNLGDTRAAAREAAKSAAAGVQ